MAESEQLLLQVPELNDFDSPVVISDPKQVSAWLDNLPVLNLAYVLRQTIDAVEPMIVNPLDAARRMKLLELYRRSAISLYPSANKDNLRQLPINTQQRKQAVIDTGLLCQHLANGYKRVAADCYRDGKQMLNLPLMHIAVYRALEMLALAVVHAFRSYSSVPAYSWLEIHQLFALAERQQAGDATIPGTSNQISIGHLYRRLLLLSISDPFHMTEGAAIQVYKQLGEYAHLARIEVRQASQADEYHIDLLADSPPVQVSRLPPETDAQAARTLDISALTHTADQHDYASLQQSSAAEHVCLRLFHPQAAGKRTRQDERLPASHRISVCFGLQALCGLIGQPDADHELLHWRILNTSDNGIAIKSSREIPNDIFVGDLAGLLDTGKQQTHQHRVLATQVRWMKQDDNGQIEIGLKYLCGDIKAAHCRLADDDPLDSRDYYGVVVTPTESPASPELILPKGAYRRGRILTLMVQGRWQTIEAGFLTTDTFTFDQFSYKVIA